MKIFIDDIRRPIDKHDNVKEGEWKVCVSYRDFEAVINELLDKKEEWITEISFDYILGDANYTGHDCFKLLARTIMKYGLPIPSKIYLHSEYPNCEQYFQSCASTLSRHNDYIPIPIIRIHENKSQTILPER